MDETKMLSLESDIRQYVDTIFIKCSSFSFHNIEHTMNVVRNVEELAMEANLTGEKIMHLRIAAWFHDVGMVVSYKGHEAESVIIMKRFFSDNLRMDINLQLIENCILATRMPQSPNTIMESIICDADLAHVGEENYFEWLGKLREEWKKWCNMSLNESEWLNLNLDFLTHHKFHTKQASLKFHSVKEKNMRKLNQMLFNVLAKSTY